MEPVHMLWWVLVETHADVGRVGKPDESSNPDGEVEPLVARRADAGR